MIRDGNGARSFETLLRYRGAAMAEFWRALRTLKALHAEQALQAEQAKSVERSREHGRVLAAHPTRPAARQQLARPQQPNEPESGALPRPEYALNEPPAPGALHEPAAPWRPNEAVAPRMPNEPEPARDRQ